MPRENLYHRLRDSTYSEAVEMYFFNTLDGKFLNLNDINSRCLIRIPDINDRYEREEIAPDQKYFIDRYSNTEEGKHSSRRWLYDGWYDWYEAFFNKTTDDPIVFIESAALANRRLYRMKKIYEAMHGKISNFKSVRSVWSADELFRHMSPELQERLLASSPNMRIDASVLFPNIESAFWPR